MSNKTNNYWLIHSSIDNKIITYVARSKKRKKKETKKQQNNQTLKPSYVKQFKDISVRVQVAYTA